ncbi:MAG: DNA internalization-related competence protein ComEC/Rec2 [Clostridiales bacterium]|nr:DNA internalization-related competence protein ComEC/Rec2 [Clostridiales bacterium]
MIQSAEVVVRGEVYKLTETKYSYEIYLKNTSIFFNNQLHPCQGILVYLKTYPNFKIGNKIQVVGTIEEFSIPRNEGEFNQYLYYKSKNINYNVEGKSYKIINTNHSLILNFLETIKNTIKHSYSEICDEKDFGIFSAIILGESSELDSEINSLYKENGISHILSISGLHISLIGMSIYKLLRKKFYFCFSCIVSVVLLLAYVALTGFSVSALRAFIMFSISILATYIGRTYDMTSATSLAAILLLLENPYLVYNAGFLLSFGAVFGISMIYHILISYLGQKSPIVSAASISISVNLMTLPILAYYFFETSTYSLILNLLIIPPMSMLMLSGILGGVVGVWSTFLGKIAIGAGHYVLSFYEGLCRLFSELPNGTILIGRPKLWQIVCYYVILFIFLFYMKKKEKTILVYKKVFRICTIFLLNIILINVLSLGVNDRFRVTFLDVSQGDGIYMESPGRTTYFIDGGSSDVSKLGKYRIIPFLKSNGINRIDYAILTHADTDHLSGLKELLEEESGIEIKTLILPKIESKDEAYLNLENIARSREIPIAYLKAGDSIIDGDLEIVCIHPSDSYNGSSKNDYSTVLSISYGGFDMLLTGDLEMGGENLVIKEIQALNKRKYEVLKVAHHGSKYSSSEEFLSKVQPDISIISCGIGNSYGHPHKELIDRLEDVESEVFITPECGGITIRTDGRKMELERTISPTLK